MIKINLDKKRKDYIIKIYIADFEKNTKEKLINHLKILENEGYKNFISVFKKQGSTLEEGVIKLIKLDSKSEIIKWKKLFETAIYEDAISEDNSSNIETIKKDILGDNKLGFGHLYKNFSNRDCAIDILKTISCNVCPYCNRIYTFTLSDNGRMKPELDHYFPKSEYPYLSLTLFNLVPSCGICNKFKSSKKTNILYPYEESFEEKNITFSLDIDDLSILYGGNSNLKVCLDANNKDNRIIEDYDNVLKISEIYSYHNDYILEILKKIIIYNTSQIDEIFINYKSLFSSKEELLRMIFGAYIQDYEHSKRPLSKLTSDILKKYYEL